MAEPTRFGCLVLAGDQGPTAEVAAVKFRGFGPAAQGHGSSFIVAPGADPRHGPDGLIRLVDAEFQRPYQVLVTVAGAARLETRDEGLHRGLPLPLDPVTDSATRLVGLVQAFPDRPLPTGIENSAVDAGPADEEGRDGLQVEVVCQGDGLGQGVEAVPEGPAGHVSAPELQDVEGVEPEAALGLALKLEGLFGARGQDRRDRLEGVTGDGPAGVEGGAGSTVRGARSTGRPAHLVALRPDCPTIRGIAPD